MKVELTTENKNNSKGISNVLKIAFDLSLIIILCFGAFKIGIIARHYQIEFRCRLLSVEKSASNFKKLSRISNLKSKQKIREFCGRFLNNN
tara:strand:- start:94 stop:366 length:273 start_codon:yes stop_codon:yes gene_type:complete